MKRLLTATCLTIVPLMLAACEPAQGYYDSQGNYVSYDRNNSRASYNPPEYPDQTRVKSVPVEKQVVTGTSVVATPVPGGTVVTTTPYATTPNGYAPYPTHVLTQRGYYTYSGVYVPTVNGANVPAHMFPPRGLCRVWVPDIAASAQRPVESCRNIETTVTPGAYVIYGG
jgi:hypothetical protein